ncbi:hypothetical protein Tco_0484491 [Tanacetum coccineum]
MGYYFYYPLENKIFVARYAEFFETRLIKQEASGSTVDFDEIQSEDAQPSENTSLHQHEVKLDTVEPQTDVIPVRRSARIPQAPERYGFYIDAEEHELGDHGEPPNYRAALSDPESEKWLEAMNVEMQSMKDNQVWNLVDLPPNYEYASFKDPFMDLSKLLGAGTRDLMRRSKIDDHITHGNNIQSQQDVKSWLGKCFAMKDLDLRKSQGPSTLAKVKQMKGIPYASAVGSIMYVVRCTRPDVAFSQNLTSRYQQDPSESHWTTIKNILKYLRNTKDIFLFYGGDSITELGVTCYIDAS